MNDNDDNNNEAWFLWRTKLELERKEQAARKHSALWYRSISDI